MTYVRLRLFGSGLVSLCGKLLVTNCSFSESVLQIRLVFLFSQSIGYDTLGLDE